MIILGLTIQLNIENSVKTVDLDYKRLTGVDVSIFDRGDIKKPSYGIISNVGSFEFNDPFGEFLQYAENGYLVDGLSVDVKLKNTLNNKVETVAKMQTSDWKYDNINRIVSVGLKDDLEDWQNIQVVGFGYNFENQYSVLNKGTMEELYKWLNSQDENGDYRTPKKYKMLTFGELSEKTKGVLSSTVLKSHMLKNGTLWEQWEKLCQVCGLYIYKNHNGKTVCSNTYGR